MIARRRRLKRDLITDDRERTKSLAQYTPTAVPRRKKKPNFSVMKDYNNNALTGRGEIDGIARV